MIFKKKHLTDEEIALYVETLKFNTTEQLDEHITNHFDGCFECQLKVNEIYELTKDDENIIHKNLPRDDQTINVPKSNMSFWTKYMVAASILLFILFSFFLYETVSVNKKHTAEEQSVKIDSTKGGGIKSNKNVMDTNYISQVENKENIDKENYKEYPALEGMLNNEFRGNSGLNVINPRNDKVFSKNKIINFQWEIKDGTPLSIILYNNQGKIIHTSDRDVNNYVLRDTLLPGLYYWKLMKEKELIYVGRFLIK